MAAAATEALVERMIENVCRFDSSVADLLSMLQVNLDTEDGVILNGERDATTYAVYGSEAQIVLMRRIWDVLQTDPWDRGMVLEVGEAAENAGSGPLFFRLILIMYKHWRQKWLPEEDEGGSEDGGDDDEDSGDEDEMEDVEDEGVGPAQVLPMSRGADMKALLAGLKNVYLVRDAGRCWAENT